MLRGEVYAQIGCAQAEQHKNHCEMEGEKPAHRDKKGPTKTRAFSVQTSASYVLSAPFCVCIQTFDQDE